MGDIGVDLFFIASGFVMALPAPGKIDGQVTLLASVLLTPGAQPLALMMGWSMGYEMYFYLVFGLMCFLLVRRGAVSAAALCRGGHEKNTSHD